MPMQLNIFIKITTLYRKTFVQLQIDMCQNFNFIQFWEISLTTISYFYFSFKGKLCLKFPSYLICHLTTNKLFWDPFLIKIEAIVNGLDTETFCAMSGWKLKNWLRKFVSKFHQNPWALQGWLLQCILAAWKRFYLEHYSQTYISTIVNLAEASTV